MTIQVLPLIGVVSVRTPRDLQALNLRTYMLCAIIGVAFVLLAAIIAQLIKYEGGSRPRDPKQRRVAFWSLLLASGATAFCYNNYIVASSVALNLKAKFMLTTVKGTLGTLVAYLVIGFILSKVFSTGKLATWFPAKHR